MSVLVVPAAQTILQTSSRPLDACHCQLLTGMQLLTFLHTRVSDTARWLQLTQFHRVCCQSAVLLSHWHKLSAV